MNTGEILQLQCFVFVLSLYIHTYINTPSRLHVPLKLGARNPREWKLADTLKMRFLINCVIALVLVQMYFET